MEASVRGEDQKSTGAIPPSDFLFAHNRLHDGIESAFGSIQVAGYGSSFHFPLQGKFEKQKSDDQSHNSRLGIEAGKNQTKRCCSY